MKRKTTVFILCILVLSVAALTLFGCSPSKKELLSYQNESIEAEMCGKINGVEFTAHIIIDKAVENAPRTFKLTLLSPSTLEGVMFSRDEDGKIIVSCGEIAIDRSAAPSGAAAIVELLTICDEPTKLSSVTGTSEGLPQYTALTRIDFPSATILIDPNTETPVKLISEGIEIYVTSFRNP